jgi:hypothetical protein
MLSIFEASQGKSARLRLVMDGILSLIRQWFLRPGFWNDVSTVRPTQVAFDGLPSFSSLDPFRPRATAVIHGVILTTTLFILTCLAIRYSWIHVLHVYIPPIEFESSSQIHPSASPSELRGAPTPASANKALRPGSSQLDKSAEHMYVEPLPVEAEDQAHSEILALNPKSKLISSKSGIPAPVLGTVEINLRSYAGKYTSKAPQLTILVGIRGDQLTMKLGDEPERIISPVSETSFIVMGSNDTKVEFGSETDGIFRRVSFSDAARQIIAQRQ